MQKGSLSFSFASRFFSKRISHRVYRLYAWCRYVDDCVDGLPPTATPSERNRVLEELERGSFALPPPADLHPAILAFRQLRAEVSFPEPYARELIAGMAMDLNGTTYDNEEQLLLYCYRVAGVVGLMMSHLMGVSAGAAYQHAADLGTAMQLTNIARDVAEDARMGRVYLPSAWLSRAGISSPAHILDPIHRAALVSVVDRALTLADQHYRSADEGLRYLPLRCALAVAIAREVYAAIGYEVKRRQDKAWDQRVWIPWPRKLRLAFRGVLRVLKTLPYRLRRSHPQPSPA